MSLSVRLIMLNERLNDTVDCGDYVVVTNARSIKVTGKKEEQLLYRKHTMFPGGLKETPYKVMKEKRPEEVRSACYFRCGLSD